MDGKKLIDFAVHWIGAGFFAYFGWLIAIWVSGHIPTH